MAGLGPLSSNTCWSSAGIHHAGWSWADISLLPGTGTLQTSCARSPRTQGCRSKASPVSVNTPRVQTVWSPCFGTSRTPIQGFSSSLSSCQEKHRCTVREYLGLYLFGEASFKHMHDVLENCSGAFIRHSKPVLSEVEISWKQVWAFN